MTALLEALDRGLARKSRFGRTAAALGMASVLLGLGAWAGAHTPSACANTPPGYSSDTPYGYQCAATKPPESSKPG